MTRAMRLPLPPEFWAWASGATAHTPAHSTSAIATRRSMAASPFRLVARVGPPVLGVWRQASGAGRLSGRGVSARLALAHPLRDPPHQHIEHRREQEPEQGDAEHAEEHRGA